MSLVKATEMERIDPCAIQPTTAEEIDTTLEGMWRSGRGSREGRLCVLRSADGVHVDALRRFTKRVSRRLPAAKIEGASPASIVQHSSDATYRPIVVVPTDAHCTPKSVLRAAAKALDLHHPSMSVAKTCTMKGKLRSCSSAPQVLLNSSCMEVGLVHAAVLPDDLQMVPRAR